MTRDEGVMSVNSGDQAVPTVVLADGTALTSPSGKDLLARLSA